MRVLIKDDTVVNADGQTEQDLLIESGIVRQLGNNISSQFSYEEIDATGCYVFLGGVNIRTHFNIDVGTAHSCDDFFTGTRAAVCGGTTTIIDHMGSSPNRCWLRHQLEVYRGYTVHKAAIDYSFHDMIQHVNHAILDEIPMTVGEGLSSFKPYLTYQYKFNGDEVLQALRRLHESDTLTTVHPEDDAAIASKRAEFIVVGLTAPRYHALSCPLECETGAITHMTSLAQIAGSASLYIVHLSNGLGLDYLRLACANHQPAWVETCPQHLLLDERSYNIEDDMKFILSPPLRNVCEQDKLRCGINDGAIDVVATDHCAFSMAQHLRISKGGFSRYPSGLPDVENRVQLLLSSGVMTGRVTPECLAELTNAVPARLFGLWSQKGLLAPGPDGDVVIINPRRSRRTWYRHLHDNADHPSWEGFTCQGAIVRTLFHGETILCDGTFTGKAGRGCFLRHKPFIPPIL